MSFLIVESKRELENYINSTKEIWGYRRGTPIRNTVISEDRRKTHSYPLLATVQSSIDHHGRFHTVSIICNRRAAKRLVYWKTSENQPLNLASFMFYVVENEEYLTKYLDKLSQNFHRMMGDLAKQVENYEIAVDDQTFDENRKEPIKLMKANKEPFMIGSLKIGYKDNHRETRISYSLKHYIIHLRDAKKLVYWKKNCSKNSEIVTHFTYDSHQPLTARLPRLRPRAEIEDRWRGGRREEIGQDTPEPPEHRESNSEEVLNNPAGRATNRRPSPFSRPAPLYRPANRPVATEIRTTNADSGGTQIRTNGEGWGALDIIEDTESSEDSVVETAQQTEEGSSVQQINSNTEPDVHQVAVYGEVDAELGRAGDIDERLRRGGAGIAVGTVSGRARTTQGIDERIREAEEEETRAQEEGVQVRREEAINQAIDRTMANTTANSRTYENTEDEAVYHYGAELLDEVSEDSRDTEEEEEG